MKLVLSTVAAGLCFGGLGYFLGGAGGGDTGEGTLTAENVATSARSSVSRPQKSSSKDSRVAITNLLGSMDRTDSRSVMKNAMAVFSLNAKEIKNLLDSPEFDNVSYYTGSNQAMFSACFSRLAEINPQDAMAVAEQLNDQKKYIAMYAIFQEWSASDAEGALDVALTIEDKRIKNTVISSALIGVAKSNPERAFKLAQENKANQALYSIVSQWAESDPVAALGKCDELPGDQKRWAMTSVISQWAQKDLAAVQTYIDGVEDTSDQQAMISGLINTLASTDQDKAFELLAQNESIATSDQMSGIIYNLGQQAPEKTLQWINNSSLDEKKKDLTRNVLSAWFNSDEDEAIAYFEAIVDADIKAAAGEGILQQLSHRDPKRYLELYEKMGSEGENNWTYRSALRKLAVEDLDYAKTYLDSIEDPKLKKEALESVMSGLSKENPDAAIEMANALDDEGEREAALAEVYEDIASENPQKVAEVFLQRGMKSIGDYDVGDFVYRYADKDIEGAKAFVDQIEDRTLWNGAVSRLLSSWSNKDPIEAAQFAFTQEPTKGIESAMWSIGRELGEKDPQKGVDLALSQPQSSISDAMMKNVLNKWVNEDLEGAIAAINRIPSDRVDLTVYGEVAEKYAETDPQQGINWISTLTDEAQINRSIYTLVDKWVEKSPDDVANYVNSIPSGNQRDSAVRSMVYNFDDAEPEYALEWASTMTHVKRRNRLVRDTYKNWKKRDPQGAQVWLNSTNLVSEAAKKNM